EHVVVRDVSPEVDPGFFRALLSTETGSAARRGARRARPPAGRRRARAEAHPARARRRGRQQDTSRAPARDQRANALVQSSSATGSVTVPVRWPRWPKQRAPRYRSVPSPGPFWGGRGAALTEGGRAQRAAGATTSVRCGATGTTFGARVYRSN